MSVITREQALSSFLKHFDDQFSATSHVQWPGRTLDTTGIDEWVRPRLGPIERPPTRRTGRPVDRCEIVVTCHARRGANAYRVDELADAAAAVLHEATISVYDYAASGVTVIGYLCVDQTCIGPGGGPSAEEGAAVAAVEVKAAARLELA